MGKKISSKGRLQLSRETLRTLSDQQMGGVVGATTGLCFGGPVIVGQTENALYPCPNLGGGAANPSEPLPENCPGGPNPIDLISIKIRHGH